MHVLYHEKVLVMFGKSWILEKHVRRSGYPFALCKDFALVSLFPQKLEDWKVIAADFV